MQGHDACGALIKTIRASRFSLLAMDVRIPVRFGMLYAEDTIKVTSRNNTTIHAPTDTGQYTSTGPEHSSRERAFAESNDT